MGTTNKTNVFLCVTEYHVLISIIIASEVFYADEYCNHIILCNGGRFNDMSRYDITHRHNIIFEKFDKEKIITKSFVNDIYNTCTGELFLYNLNFKHFIYIAYKLKKEKNIPTSFVQEGLASYAVLRFSTHKILSDLRSSLRLFKSIGIKDICFYLYCYGFKGRFGRILLLYKNVVESRLVHNIWLTSPSGALYGKDKVKTIPLFSEKSLKLASSFFMYDKGELFLKKNDILFVDQNLPGCSHFILELSKHFSSSVIYIKLHPSAPESLVDEYQKISNVSIINTLKGIPVDLLIQELENVVVITPYSSALLIDNPSCHYYYMYPWLLENGYGQDIPIESIHNPTRFIKEVNKVSDIVLFNN